MDRSAIVGFSPSESLLSRYRVEARCGAGATGEVYRAWDLQLRRWVALKFLRHDRPEHRTRMLREARAQARINHPNVCRIFDVGQDGERPYIAMEWIDGKRLDVLSPQLSIEEKVRIVRDTADGLHAGHAEGIIHRDVKPANILVEQRSETGLHPYIVDFGLARASEDARTTATGEIVGTPHYLSPEQAWGLPLDRRSDVYSLGVTLYELLSGSPPYAGSSPTDILVQVISREAPPLRRRVKSIPRDLSIIAEICLQKDPAQRYESARALRDDLTRWLNGEPITGRKPGFLYRASAGLRRHRRLAIAVTGAVLVTASVAGYRILQLQNERAQRDVTAQLEGRVQYIERLLDHDRALPVHDIRPALRRASREISALAHDVSGAARFPAAVAYAEGRARLATGDVGSARKSLETAWNSGFRNPSAAYHFAVALANEYALARAEADRIPDEVRHRARLAELQKHYRTAALPLLQIARRSGEQPAALVEARIAFIDGDDRRTTAMADVVLSRFPWNNEARLLQAESHVRVARRKRLAGDVSGAKGSFQRAREVYERASVIAPSDPRIQGGLCQIAADTMQIAGPFSTQFGSADDRSFEEALSACTRALIVDPQSVSALINVSSAWSLVGFQRNDRGLDNTEENRNAVETIERALKIAPNDPAVLIHAGLAHWRAPGREDSELAMAYLRRAVAADPRSVEARHSLGRVLLRRNDEIMTAGGDPRAALAEAIKQYREVLRLAPDHAGGRSNLAIAYFHFGMYAIRLHLNPEPYHRQAIAILNPLIVSRPQLAEPRSICAWAWAAIAEYRISQGMEALAEIEMAGKLFDEAIRISPHYSGDYGWRSHLRLLEASAAPERALGALALADADLTAVERMTKNAPYSLARAEWYRMMAIHSRDKAAAREYVRRARRIIDTVFVSMHSDQRAGAWFVRGRLERAACRVDPLVCDPSQAEGYFRRVLAVAPGWAAQVERARTE